MRADKYGSLLFQEKLRLKHNELPQEHPRSTWNKAAEGSPGQGKVTMLDTAPAYIFYPLIMLWSLIYGAVAGAFFKLLAVWENWIAINRYQLILWKKYPQRSYHKYISSIWANQIRGKPFELAEYTRDQIERSQPHEPFPLLRIIINTCFMLLIAPFMVLLGLVKGPSYVYRKAVERRHRLLATGR